MEGPQIKSKIVFIEHQLVPWLNCHFMGKTMAHLVWCACMPDKSNMLRPASMIWLCYKAAQGILPHRPICKAGQVPHKHPKRCWLYRTLRWCGQVTSVSMYKWKLPDTLASQAYNPLKYISIWRNGGSLSAGERQQTCSLTHPFRHSPNPSLSRPKCLL